MMAGNTSSPTAVSKAARDTILEYYDFAFDGMLKCDQRQVEKVPWREITTFLEAVEPERSMEGLAARTLEAIHRLFDFDFAFLFVADARNITQGARYAASRQAPESSLREYAEHYFETDPVIRKIPGFQIGYADWARYEENEFTREFLPRAGTSHSIGVSNLIQTGALGVVLILNRGGREAYGEEDLLKMAALYPHIHNLSSMILSPAKFRTRQLMQSFDAAGLSPREQEVALLLCERLSVSEIAERLFVSRRTVANLEHIYQKLGVHGKRRVYENLFSD